MAITILRLPAVKARTGLGVSTIYLRISNGEFPESVSLGSRAVGWIESEIDDWLEERVAASRSDGELPAAGQVAPEQSDTRAMGLVKSEQMARKTVRNSPRPSAKSKSGGVTDVGISKRQLNRIGADTESPT
jgi:prophage regulatory protein